MWALLAFLMPMEATMAAQDQQLTGNVSVGGQMAVVLRRHPFKVEIIGSNPIRGTKRSYKIGPWIRPGAFAMGFSYISPT